MAKEKKKNPNRKKHIRRMYQLHGTPEGPTLVEMWEKQDKETDEKFQAFRTYLEMGEERSFKAVAEKLGHKQTTVYSWSWEWSWKARVTAWDRYEWRQLRKAHLKDVIAMRKRHADIARGMLQKAASYVDQMLSGELDVKEIAKWVDVAAKLERLSMGESTESVQIDDQSKTKPDANLFRDPEIRRLIDQAAARSAQLARDTGGNGGEA
jgi:hypothetical protein